MLLLIDDDCIDGSVGDEGLFAPCTIPNSRNTAGPTNHGARNYPVPGPGPGEPNSNGDHEVLLDEIPYVIPLRATGFAMLKGANVLAEVYKGDKGINCSPIKGNLRGANPGLVALEITGVAARSGDGLLPGLQVRIKSSSQTKVRWYRYFLSNAASPLQLAKRLHSTAPESTFTGLYKPSITTWRCCHLAKAVAKWLYHGCTPA